MEDKHPRYIRVYTRLQRELLQRQFQEQLKDADVYDKEHLYFSDLCYMFLIPYEHAENFMSLCVDMMQMIDSEDPTAELLIKSLQSMHAIRILSLKNLTTLHNFMQEQYKDPIERLDVLKFITENCNFFNQENFELLFAGNNDLYEITLLAINEEFASMSINNEMPASKLAYVCDDKEHFKELLCSWELRYGP